MTDKYIYRTDNYHLACFLLGRGAEFQGVGVKPKAPEETDEDHNIRLEFLFKIPDSINLAKLLVWWCSKDADEIKSILAATKTLKRAISQHLSK